MTEKKPVVVFYHDDVLLPAFLRRYLDKARRVPGYEKQAAYIEQVIENIDTLKPFSHAIPEPNCDYNSQDDTEGGLPDVSDSVYDEYADYL